MKLKGLESDENEEEWNERLFLLSLLLSSLFIYNTKNALEKSAFEKLATMSIISSHIKVNSNDHQTSDLRSECPDFIWVVRDFSLEKTLSPNQRLERFLTPEKFESDQNKKENEHRKNQINHRNDIRDKMKQTFKSINAFYLPVPVSDGVHGKTLEQSLQSLDSLQFDDLRGNFQDSINEFVSLINETVQFKQINHMTMNGPIFAEFFKIVVDNLNSNKMICLHDTISSSVQNVSFEILEEMKEKYIESMEDMVSLNTLPMKWTNFKSAESLIVDESIEILSSRVDNESSPVYSKVFKEFKNFRKEKFSFYNEINKLEIDKYNNKLIDNNWKAQMAPKCIDCNVSYKCRREFYDDLEKFKKDLRTKLFECDDFEQTCFDFMGKINFQAIESKIKEHFDKLEKREEELRRATEEKMRKEIELKAAKDAEERLRQRVYKEIEEKMKREALERSRKEAEERAILEKRERERKEEERRAFEKRAQDKLNDEIRSIRRQNESQLEDLKTQMYQKAKKDLEETFFQSTLNDSDIRNKHLSPLKGLSIETPPPTPIKSNVSYYSPRKRYFEII